MPMTVIKKEEIFDCIGRDLGYTDWFEIDQ